MESFWWATRDMHPGLDCADALLGTQELFYQIMDEPDFVKEVIQRCAEPFLAVMDQFHAKLFAHGQLSVTWMQIPSYEGMHIPSCDLGAMVSEDTFNEFALPYIQQEVKHFRHNIFHVDGKGVGAPPGRASGHPRDPGVSVGTGRRPGSPDHAVGAAHQAHSSGGEERCSGSAFGRTRTLYGCGAAGRHPSMHRRIRSRSTAGGSRQAAEMEVRKMHT